MPRHARSGQERPLRAHRVAHVDEIPPGERRIVMVGGRSIGVFNVHGTFHAIRNLCPHQQAPLCEGPLLGTTLPSRPGEYVIGREGEVLRCPWHGWEFDVTTGLSLFDPGGCRVRAYPVTVEGGDVPGAPRLAPGASDDKALAVERFDVSVHDSYVFVHT